MSSDLARTAATALALALFLPGCHTSRNDEPAADRPVRPCAACGRELGSRTVAWREKAYHPACYERAGPVCGVCRAVIHGRFVSLAGGLHYHDRCFEEAPRCEGCGLPAAGARGEATRWDDGRVTCAVCRADAALEPSDARSASDRARVALARVLRLDLGAIEAPVTLVGKQELLARAGSLAHPALKALTEVEEDAPELPTKRGERRYRIYALYGLPRAGLEGVLAHELFHVLQSEAGSAADAEPAFREGSANYVQVRLLRAAGDELRAHVLEHDRDPVYGEGLRRFERLVHDRGEPDALDLGRRARCFPQGY